MTNIEPIVTRNRRKWSVRILLFLLWSTVMALLCSALFVAGSYILYRHRTAAVNHLLRELASPFVVEVGGIHRYVPGVIEIEDLRLRLEEGGATMFDSPSLRIGYSWTENRTPRIDSVTIADPEIVLGDDFLDALETRRTLGAQKGGAPGVMGIVTKEITIEGGRLETKFTDLPGLEFDFDIVSRDMRRAGGAMSPEPMRIMLEKVRFANGAGADEEAVTYFELPALEIGVRAKDMFRSGTVEPLEVNDMELSLTPGALAAVKEFIGAFKAPKKEEGVAVAVPEIEKEAGAEEAGAGWKLEDVRFAGGRFSMSGFEPPVSTKALPDVSFNFEGEFIGLNVAGGVLASSERQHLRLHDVAINGGDATATAGSGASRVARIKNIAMEFDLDALLEGRLIEKIHIEEPVIDVTRDTIARFLPEKKVGSVAPSSAPREESAAAEEEGTARENAFVVRHLAVSGGSLTVDPKKFQDRVPGVSAAFELSTRGDEGNYRLQFKQLRLRNPEVDTEDFGKVELIDIDFSAAGVQRDQTFDRIGVQGFHMTIGKALQKMIGTGDEPGAAGAVPGKPKGGEGPLEGWKIGEVDLQKSTVTVRDILPDFPAITFGVQTRATLKDLTVGSGEGKASNLKQRVELVNLEIASKYNPSIPVADLRTIWVEFTLGGLLKREIELVEIGSPDIYVGEHLFWYIDYQRNLQAGKAGGGEEEVKVIEDAAGGAGGEILVAAAGPGGEAAAEALVTEVIDSGGKGWTVKRIDAHNGRLIFAPKGVPVGFNPFPFSVSTNLEMGEIDLEMQVPSGTYTFPNMELELEGLQGTAQFNVPIKQKDNNLVQTFSMEKLRFRKYEADEVWLTITYDKAGIYTIFGGQAYEGYLNGGFNVYVGDKYGWDAWVSGAEIELKPLTEAAAPENFLMQGRVNGEIVAGGLEDAVAIAHGDLTTLTKGSFQVTKLNEFLENLPKEWTQLKKTLTGIGVSRLRDFNYDDGRGQVEFRNLEVPLVKELKLPYYEREEEFTIEEPKGIFTLDLKGEEGSRSIELIYHDRRGKEQPGAKPLNVSNP